MTIHDALRAVVAEAPTHKGFIGYAKAYALRALTDRMEGEALERNILYILGNLAAWRGGRAREVKKVLKSFKP